ncbi:ribokinase [Bifidobacterium jacchi]|uniref:Ribokinase n=2 Tax=Bifidobacterium jacchi TaxID=2490545 RepID=A0A5N5RCP1_9BIFI|nr:ribokinase [Bifidobacterium jacchi]
MAAAQQADARALLSAIADEANRGERGRVAILGSMNADYTVRVERLPQPGETVPAGPMVILPGGKSGNQSAAAARIGANVHLFGALGDDDNAEMLAGRLADAGVDTSGLMRVPGPSGSTVITVDAHGENTIAYSAGANAHVDAAYARRAVSALVGDARGDAQRNAGKPLVAGLCLESPMDAVIAFSQAMHQAGATVLLNDSPFRALPTELVENVDVLLVNEHELADLLNAGESADAAGTEAADAGDAADAVDAAGDAAADSESDAAAVVVPDAGDVAAWQPIARRLHDAGFARAIVTLGGDGSVVLDRDGITPVPVVPVKAVDTTGCGDAFMGGVLAGLAAELSLADAARAAALVAAYAATGEGAQNSYGTAATILAAL